MLIWVKICNLYVVSCGDGVDNTVEENSSVFSLIRMRWLPFASKGMQAVTLCTNKILQFLTGGAGQRRLTCIMAVRWCLLYGVLYVNGHTLKTANASVLPSKINLQLLCLCHQIDEARYITVYVLGLVCACLTEAFSRRRINSSCAFLLLFLYYAVQKVCDCLFQ